MRHIVKKYLALKTIEEMDALIGDPKNIRVNFELVIEQAYEHLRTCPLRELPRYVNLPRPLGQGIIRERLQKG